MKKISKSKYTYKIYFQDRNNKVDSQFQFNFNNVQFTLQIYFIL